MFISHHSYAVQIESIMRNIFNLKFTDGFGRNGFGGIADANYADSNPYAAISCGLAVNYNNVSKDKKLLIDTYLDSYYFNRNKSITELGEPEIKKMIKEFSALLKVV